MERKAHDGALSIDEFCRMPEEDAWRLELVRGRVVREPRPAPLHGRVLSRLSRLLDEYAEASGEGAVFADTGFVLREEPPTVRGPDLAFVARARLPENGYPEGLWRLVPDLTVEIVSPVDRATEPQEKVLEYLHAGVRRVWVVDPSAWTLTVYGPEGRARILGPDEALEDPDLLPGLRLPLERLFRL